MYLSSHTPTPIHAPCQRLSARTREILLFGYFNAEPEVMWACPCVYTHETNVTSLQLRFTTVLPTTLTFLRGTLFSPWARHAAWCLLERAQSSDSTLYPLAQSSALFSWSSGGRPATETRLMQYRLPLESGRLCPRCVPSIETASPMSTTQGPISTKVWPEWRRAFFTSAIKCPGRHLGAASLGQSASWAALAGCIGLGLDMEASPSPSTRMLAQTTSSFLRRKRVARSSASWLLPASRHAPGCPKLQQASANQPPVGPHWPAISGLVSTWPRTGS